MPPPEPTNTAAATRMPEVRPPVIGLLGAPGSGKSLVARLMGEQGCAVIDADALARDALGEQEVLDQIHQWWGDGVIGDDRKANRAALAAIVFGDVEQRRRLEGLIHPHVHAGRQHLREQYQANPAVRAIVEDTPLLMESGLADSCDVLVYVDVPYEVRLARVSEARGWDAAELNRREKSQHPLDSKRQAADYIVDNSGSEAETGFHVRRLLSRIVSE